ncbi:conjugal transfer pilus assembly protein TraK [Legionella quinlivanii DSM 21216]|uniref:type-F conjugative transfer system secretin TraK n=1 Tax=Legionella quinlivanii TaxID=45073 RepID=UPI00089E4FEB|nr:type-F conjugative transfer system secretin TraK [Legionella quinlivanii]SEG42158.1 conjugal transfer pilus assembly protein TraK [Legionella quinlivanii DSM 21216]
MHKPFGIALALSSTVALGANSIPVKDNGDIALTLSQGNYNRLVVKNDKVMEAVFPRNAMAIKRDPQDGSVYVMLAANNPFTLFLTTEAGRHFSITLNGEESLGKTIELVPVSPVLPSSKTVGSKTNSKAITQEAVPEAILALLTHMEQQKPFADVTVKRPLAKVERWSKGLTLLPKESWEGKLLKGEAIELYNGGKESLELAEGWFAKEETLAIKLSKPAIAPGEKAMLYRVLGVKHG